MALFNEDAQDVQRQAVGVGGPQGLKQGRPNPKWLTGMGGPMIDPMTGKPQGGGGTGQQGSQQSGPGWGGLGAAAGGIWGPAMGGGMSPASPYGSPSNGGINSGGMYIRPNPDPAMPMPGDPGTQTLYQDAPLKMKGVGEGGGWPPSVGHRPGNGGINPGGIYGGDAMPPPTDLPGPRFPSPGNTGPMPPPPGMQRPIDPRNAPITPPPPPNPDGWGMGMPEGGPPPIEDPHGQFPQGFQRPWLGQTGRQQVANPLGLGHGGGHPAFQPPQTQVPINFANGFNNPNAQQGGAYNGQMRPQPVAPRESPMFPSRPKQQPQQQAGGNDGLNNYLRSF